MKKLIKFFALSIVLLSLAAGTFAQVADVATVTATIVTPITITKTVDMNFGNAAVNATPGTILLLPAGTRSATGGVSFLTGNPGTVTAAEFDITGLPAATYSISITNVPVTVTDGTNNMTVDTFTRTPAGAGTLTGGGTETVFVGATLNVPASQPAGVYASVTPFTVTVNYN